MAGDSKVYDQHRSAFANVSAYVLLDGGTGEKIGTVAFKHGNRCWCYFHVHGQRMERGFADGGGYDKASAAAWAAVRKISEEGLAQQPETLARIKAVKDAIKDNGYSWERELENAGFKLVQAV